MAAQLDMFGDVGRPEPSSPTADPERVRRKLEAMLAEARCPDLPNSRRRLIETLVPQMVRWLPDDEAERLKLEIGEALAA
jgi:hypothetical protein